MSYVGIYQSRNQIGSLHIVVIHETFSIDRVLVKTDSVADASISILKCMQPLSSALVDLFVILHVFPWLPIYPPICLPIYRSHCLPINPLLLLPSYSMSTHLPPFQSPTTASFPSHHHTSTSCFTYPHLPFPYPFPSPHLPLLHPLPSPPLTHPCQVCSESPRKSLSTYICSMYT